MHVCRPVRCRRRRMRACPAAGHVIRIWMPRTGAPHISQTPVIRIECVDSVCRGQGSSPVELFHQIQRLNAAARTSTSTSTQMHAHATQAQRTSTDGRMRGGPLRYVRACPRGKSYTKKVAAGRSANVRGTNGTGPMQARGLRRIFLK
jgi:hypothetical protein